MVVKEYDYQYAKPYHNMLYMVHYKIKNIYIPEMKSFWPIIKCMIADDLF